MRTNALKRVASNGRVLLFVKPKSACDANVFADRLLGLDCVEEVLLTSGDVGFVIRARIGSAESGTELERLIKSSTGSQCMHASTHYAYRRARLQ